MNRRQQMRESNRRAVEYLLEKKYDHIYLKPHKDNRKGKNVEVMKSQKGSYPITDFFNLFDGFCVSPDGLLVWIQVKTDAWPNEKAIIEFLMDKQGFFVMALNVRKPTKTIRKYRVDTKMWSY